MSRFLESICFNDGTFLHLDLHQDRVNRTFAAFYPGVDSIKLSEVLTSIDQDGKYKFRVEYDEKNAVAMHSEYATKPINSLKIVETNIDYSYKYSARDELNRLLRESGCDEIIMIKNGLITDSSYSNLAFFDGKKWWTPNNPLLKGVRRSALINSGKLERTNIAPKDISRFQRLSLINSMLDLGDLSLPVSLIS